MIYEIGNEYLSFYINLDNVEGLLIPIKISLKGKEIGDFSDPTYMPVFFHRLERCLKITPKINLELNNSEDVFKYLMDDDTSSEYVVGLGDSFDKYYMFFFYYNDNIYFTWVEDGTGKINMEYINKSYLQNAVNELSEFINKHLSMDYLK